MSNMVSRDYGQTCRRLSWSSFGALIPLGPCHTSVVLLAGTAEAEEWWLYEDCMGLVCYVKLHTDLYRCSHTDLCLLHVCCGWPHVCKSQFEGAAVLIWSALLMPQTSCANKAEQLSDETFLICLHAMEQHEVCLQKTVGPYYASKVS